MSIRNEIRRAATAISREILARIAESSLGLIDTLDAIEASYATGSGEVDCSLGRPPVDSGPWTTARIKAELQGHDKWVTNPHTFRMFDTPLADLPLADFVMPEEMQGWKPFTFPATPAVREHRPECVPAACVPGCDWQEELDRYVEAGHGVRDDEGTRAKDLAGYAGNVTAIRLPTPQTDDDPAGAQRVCGHRNPIPGTLDTAYVCQLAEGHPGRHVATGEGYLVDWVTPDPFEARSELCGALEPVPDGAGRAGYLCDLRRGHKGSHEASGCDYERDYDGLEWQQVWVNLDAPSRTEEDPT